MPIRRTHPWLALVALLAVLPALAAPPEDLSSAYTAILRGDYDAGSKVLQQLSTHGGGADVAAAGQWLDSYRTTVSSREELRSKSFDWNMEHARQALGADKLFLALSFTAQAAPYAEDAGKFVADPWVAALLDKVEATAKDFEKADKWSKALAYYNGLSRIRTDDPRIKALREEAVRHARLELTYKKKDDIAERIRGVDKDLLKNAIRRINSYYYREPDFRALAEGGLQNLLSLCNAAKMRELLDGVGNPALRARFAERLQAALDGLKTREQFDYKDLIRVFNDAATANKDTVEIPDGLLVVEFLEGALQHLDEYSAMIWPADAVEFDKVMMGGFEGVGIQLGLDELTGRLKVVTPLEDSPALEAGIQPDDLIVDVNGETTKGWTTEDAVRKIMGPSGTPVELAIFRPSEAERVCYKLTRRKITLRTVRGVEREKEGGDHWNFMLDKDAGVAYIRLDGFHADSDRELHRALESAAGQGMKGLVLDLRNNPGGLLDVAIEVVSEFVKKGAVVSTRGRVEEETRADVTGDAAFGDLPLVVLVNDGSASASEILSGALQDHARAIVLGERTFGKGSVQRVLPLDNNARLKLTTALYYLPSGRSPHKALSATDWGVDPNLHVKLMPKEFRRIILKQRDTAIIHNDRPAAHKELTEDERKAKLDELKSKTSDDEDADLVMLSDEDIKLLESDPSEAPDADPQLATALLQLRVKLAANLPWPGKLAAANSGSSDKR